MRTRQETRLNTILSLFAVLAFAACHPLIAQTLPVWGELEPGPHHVGVAARG